MTLWKKKRFLLVCSEDEKMIAHSCGNIGNLHLFDCFICCSALKHFVVTCCQSGAAATVGKANYCLHNYVAQQPDKELVLRRCSVLTTRCSFFFFH